MENKNTKITDGKFMTRSELAASLGVDRRVLMKKVSEAGIEITGRVLLAPSDIKRIVRFFVDGTY